MSVRICRHCQQPFTTRPCAGRRKYCYKLECIKKEEARAFEHKAYLARKQYKKIKARLCSRCGHRPVGANNHFLCNECFEEAGQEFEAYTGYGVDRSW